MHVLITGASSGIGAALASAWSARGARLTLLARREAELTALAGALGAPCHVAAVDLLDPPDGWLEATEAAHGPVDVLVNNAGVQVIGPTHRVDAAAGARSLALNLTVPLQLIHRVLPGMRERGRGTIVNIASMAALAPTPGMTWYNAGKAGLAAASEALRGELAGTGVDVLTVYPGIIPDTAMGREGLQRYHAADHALLRWQPHGTPDGLAAAVVHAAEGRAARLIWPRANALARHFPAATRWMMDRFTPTPAAP